MEASAKRKWLAFSLMAVVLPMGLLVAFKLTGIIPDPPTPETITVDLVSWEMDRPSLTVNFGGTLLSTYTNDVASIRASVSALAYEEDSYDYRGRDGMGFHVRVNASVTQGFIASILVRAKPNDAEAYLFFEEGSYFTVAYNATITDGRFEGSNNTEAYVEATPNSSPCALKVVAHWVFMDEQGGHEADISSEVTYYNGNSYQKVVMPTRLKIEPDVGNSFETAKSVTSGEYRGCLDEKDHIDIYAIYLEQGQTINVTLTPSKDSNFDLYLYDIFCAEVGNSTQIDNTEESIVFTANSTGNWYVKAVRPAYGWKGVYQLEIALKG